MSMISKCLWCPNIHDVQMSMLWSQFSHMGTFVTCGHTCHRWSHLSQEVTLVTCVNVVTLVTCGHTCYMWSHLSNVVTLVTCVTLQSEKPTFSMLTKKCIRCLRTTTTWPTYRPAQPQVKNVTCDLHVCILLLLYRMLFHLENGHVRHNLSANDWPLTKTAVKPLLS